MNIVEKLKERKQVLKLSAIALMGAAAVYMVPAYMSSAMVDSGTVSQTSSESVGGATSDKKNPSATKSDDEGTIDKESEKSSQADGAATQDQQGEMENLFTLSTADLEARLAELNARLEDAKVDQLTFSSESDDKKFDVADESGVETENLAELSDEELLERYIALLSTEELKAWLGDANADQPAFSSGSDDKSFVVTDEPIDVQKQESTDTKPQEIEISLKILECLPMDEEGLKKFLELPNKDNLTEKEKEIYDEKVYSEIETKVKEIIQDIDDTKPGSKQLKIANAIYRWVANNIKYIKKEQESVFEVFKNGYGVCRGYSRLTNLMMRMAGIPCVYIGTSSESLLDQSDDKGHAFNAIYIKDGDRTGWTLLDATWAVSSEEIKDGIYEQDLFKQDESDLAKIKDDFIKIINDANLDKAWDYAFDVKFALEEIIINHIAENNVDQINNKISKKLLEINSNVAYKDINKFSAIEIKVVSDDKSDSEHFLSSLKLVIHLSKDAQEYFDEKIRYFPALYKKYPISFEDANRRFLSMEGHRIGRLSNELCDEEFCKNIHPQENGTGIIYSLEGDESNAKLRLSSEEADPISIDLAKISSHGLPIKIGSGIKSLSLRNEDVDIREACDLKHIDTTGSTRYEVEDEVLYELKDGKRVAWQVMRITEGGLHYEKQLNADGKIEGITVTGDMLDLIIPEKLISSGLKINVFFGIKSLTLQSSEEIDIGAAWNLERIDAKKSTRYVVKKGMLYDIIKDKSTEYTVKDGKLCKKNPDETMGREVYQFEGNVVE